MRPPTRQVLNLLQDHSPIIRKYTDAEIDIVSDCYKGAVAHGCEHHPPATKYLRCSRFECATTRSLDGTLISKGVSLSLGCLT